MKVYFAGDHAGFEMKQELMEFVRGLGHEVEDMGPLEPKSGDDYSDYVIPLAKKVAKGAPFAAKGVPFGVRGIVVAGSGQGEIIAMNRIKGARGALLAPGPQMVPLIIASRDHNDSNIFSIGARFCTLEEAKKAITVWLETPFSNAERHIRRLQKNDVYGS
ncbi:MAG: RpiB/LacA/LacB family sugar-phosphate isomerase [bacterium]|nr:RpiB/LacA/LacB family sugar-phosphate isomerase [bacterium]